MNVESAALLAWGIRSGLSVDEDQNQDQDERGGEISSVWDEMGVNGVKGQGVVPKYSRYL